MKELAYSKQPYSHSWDWFSRVFFVQQSLWLSDKHVFIFENTHTRDIFIRNYEAVFGECIETIETYGDCIEFFCQKEGLFAITLDIFLLDFPPAHFYEQHILALHKGYEISQEDMITTLVEAGYECKTHYEEKTYFLAGDILTVTTESGVGYRISFFGDEIDELHEFSKESTQDMSSVQTAHIAVAPKTFAQRVSDKLQDSVAKAVLSQENTSIWLMGLELNKEYGSILKWFPKRVEFIDIYNQVGAQPLHVEDIICKDIHVLKDILVTKNKQVICYTKNIRTLQGFLQDNEIENIEIHRLKGIYGTSFQTKDTIVLSDDIFSKIFIKKRTRKKISSKIDLLLQIQPGDFVVHIHHGVGKFEEIIKKDLGGVEREYMQIAYANDEKLYVPLQELYRVSKYVGTSNPTLTALGKQSWVRVLAKTNAQVEKIAKELLEIYAKRKLAKGYSFFPFTTEEQKFLDDAPFVYTKDQQTARDEILENMEQGTPMDRLLTGDVGFGKTEVAMQALYRAYLHKKQSILLTPLVVLAYEHFETLQRRFASFGVRVALLSRMSSTAEQKRVLQGLKDHTIDCVVGTHRLLSENVAFANLGLLIVDEEHKFGVVDKEKINKLKANIDTLTMSATPIPRSLNLALSGIKDISVLTTPPPRKKPIHTIVNKSLDSLIKEACIREFERKGKVFFVHNKVATLDAFKNYIEKVVGKEAKIVTIHGQMRPHDLEEHLFDFKQGKYNVLLTTTVIENGVNFFDTNTIIIHEAEKFGLSQLHQLRGRVGRKDIQGYCYLLYKRSELKPIEKERLVTIANNSHLGAGFEIASKDMEIRGTGEILGIKQSGKATEVGVGVYLKLLEQKIDELKTGKKHDDVDCKIELPISYSIPDTFFGSELDKIHFFRSIEALENEEDLQYMYDTLVKGVDSIPDTLNNLFLMLNARLVLQKFGIQKLQKVGANYVFEFIPNIPVENIKAFLKKDTKRFVVLVGSKRAHIPTRHFDSVQKFLQYLCK